MFEWSEEQVAIRDAVRRFVSEEIKPTVEDLEHGGLGHLGTDPGPRYRWDPWRTRHCALTPVSC
jgi:hypothetical protein